MTMQQERRIQRLEVLLHKAEKVLSVIATDSFIPGEKFCECMWCGHDEQNTHYEKCLALQAVEVAREIERAIAKHKIGQGA